MTKKHFVALADMIRQVNSHWPESNHFNPGQISELADFCKSQNPRFNCERWISYINGECGPGGGEVRK